MTKLDKILKKIKLSEVLNMKYMFWDGYIDDGFERHYYPERFTNELKDFSTEIKAPEIGSRWKHYNGIEYTVLHIANIGGGKNYKETVVHQGDNGKVWTRELEDWYRSFSTVV